MTISARMPSWSKFSHFAIKSSPWITRRESEASAFEPTKLCPLLHKLACWNLSEIPHLCNAGYLPHTQSKDPIEESKAL